MSHWNIKSRDQKWFRVRLNDCDKAHARSVVKTLEECGEVPGRLYLRRRVRRNK